MVVEQLFESNYKKLGLLQVNQAGIDLFNESEIYKPYIKILLLPKGYTINVDFKQFTTTQDSLFFINTNQFFQFQKKGKEDGQFLYYNRDFYCIMIHDDEVACDGLLFHNIYDMPVVKLDARTQPLITSLFKQIKNEFDEQDASQEEMIRTCLKQILLRAARAWKKQHLGKEISSQQPDMDFFRHFSRLIEIHFRQKHTVADYADLLHLAPKTITHKFQRMGLSNPNEIIKDRIVLEAKRLLIHTACTAKEIAYELGYEDPAYFNRLFTQKVGSSPVSFRKEYNG